MVRQGYLVSSPGRPAQAIQGLLARQRRQGASTGGPSSGALGQDSLGGKEGEEGKEGGKDRRREGRKGRKVGRGKEGKKRKAWKKGEEGQVRTEWGEWKAGGVGKKGREGGELDTCPGTQGRPGFRDRMGTSRGAPSPASH